MFFCAFRRSENIIITIMISRTPSPATKPANCDEERSLPLSEAGDFTKFVSDMVVLGNWLLDGLDDLTFVGTLFLSENLNKLEVIIILLKQREIYRYFIL